MDPVICKLYFLKMLHICVAMSALFALYITLCVHELLACPYSVLGALSAVVAETFSSGAATGCVPFELFTVRHCTFSANAPILSCGISFFPQTPVPYC